MKSKILKLGDIEIWKDSGGPGEPYIVIDDGDNVCVPISKIDEFIELLKKAKEL